jgi:hypothetical protein
MEVINAPTPNCTTPITEEATPAFLEKLSNAKAVQLP